MPTASTAAAPTPSRRLLNARQAADLLGCSWRTLYRLADAGRVPFGCKLGALRRWDAAELDRFIADGCRPLASQSKRPDRRS